MKNKLICVLLVCVLLFCLAACNNTATKSDETTGSEITTEETKKDETKAPENKLGLNQDLLSEIGKTYGELTQKHGDKYDTENCGGGLGYYLEGGYGAYVWSFDSLDYGDETTENQGYPIPRDEQGKAIIDKVQIPKPEEKCTTVILIKARDLFADASFPIAVSEVENLENIEEFRTAEDGIATSYNYGTSFIYNGIEIHIYHNDKEIIESDSKVNIFEYWDRTQ